MGYPVAILPIEEARDAAAIYERWPAADVPSTVGSEAFLSSLIRAFPTIAARPSRSGTVISLDDDAPFELDIDGGLVVLDVSWDALTRVLPTVRSLAADAGVAMYLPFEGTLLLPDDRTDLREAWADMSERQVRAIDDAVESAHRGMAHRDAATERLDPSPPSVAHTVYLWVAPCDGMRSAARRAADLQKAADGSAGSDPVLREAARRIRRAVPGSVAGSAPANGGVTILELPGGLIVKIGPEAIEQVGPELITIGLELGLQVYDRGAGILTPI